MVIWSMSLETSLKSGIPRSRNPPDTLNFIGGTGIVIVVGSTFEVSSGFYDSMVGTEQLKAILTSSTALHKDLRR